jgi:hypothetical protein
MRHGRDAPTPVGVEVKSPMNTGDSRPVDAYDLPLAMYRTQEAADSSPASPMFSLQIAI